MPRTTLPTNDLLSLVGAGAAAHTPQRHSQPVADANEHQKAEPPQGVARRSITPNQKAVTHPGPVRSSIDSGVAGAGRKEKFNCRIPPHLTDAIRDCVVSLSGPPHRYTIDSFAEEAFRRELERLERAHHGGQPFARRPYNPKPGRPVA